MAVKSGTSKDVEPMAPEPESFTVRLHHVVDTTAFVIAGIAAVWYAALSITEAIHLRWWLIPLGILFWGTSCCRA